MNGILILNDFFYEATTKLRLPQVINMIISHGTSLSVSSWLFHNYCFFLILNFVKAEQKWNNLCFILGIRWSCYILKSYFAWYFASLQGRFWGEVKTSQVINYNLSLQLGVDQLCFTAVCCYIFNKILYKTKAPLRLTHGHGAARVARNRVSPVRRHVSTQSIRLFHH